MTRDEALNHAAAQGWRLSSTFGHPGCGQYAEIYRAPDGSRHEISNGPWDALEPFTWTIRQISEAQP